VHAEANKIKHGSNHFIVHTFLERKTPIEVQDLGVLQRLYPDCVEIKMGLLNMLSVL